MEQQKTQKIFRKQPILCPWITSQPYHSSLMNKNRIPTQADPTLANRFVNNPWLNKQPSVTVVKPHDKQIPSIQQSSSQFFHFVRLMQLFPDTHPATLHTVLTLCKNDFFCAVDKLLYAKRCKILCYKKSLAQKLTPNRGKNNNGPYDTTMKNLNNNVDLTTTNMQVANNKDQNIDSSVKSEDLSKTAQNIQNDDKTTKSERDVQSEISDSIIINLYQDSVEDLSTEK